MLAPRSSSILHYHQVDRFQPRAQKNLNYTEDTHSSRSVSISSGSGCQRRGTAVAPPTDQIVPGMGTSTLVGLNAAVATLRNMKPPDMCSRRESFWETDTLGAAADERRMLHNCQRESQVGSVLDKAFCHYGMPRSTRRSGWIPLADCGASLIDMGVVKPMKH